MTKLNLEINKRISELQHLLKQFELKKKVYKIIIKGKGLDFDGFRAYTPSDDASLIDWKATKRANKVLIKQYKEEDDLSAIFAVDCGKRMLTGSSQKLKCEYAAEVAASLAYLTLNSNNKAGFIFFNKKNYYIAPTKGKNSFYMAIDELSKAERYDEKTDFLSFSNFLLNVINKKIDSVIIISDFLFDLKKVEKEFKLIGRKFETMAIVIRDPIDKKLPKEKGEVFLEDPETGEQIITNTKLIENIYEKIMKEHDDEMKKIFLENGIDFIELQTNSNFSLSLTEFIKRRIREETKYGNIL